MKEARLNRFKEKIDIPVLIENPIDLFYLTGMPFSKGRLLVSRDGVTLYLDGRYLDEGKKLRSIVVKHWDDFREVECETIHFDSAYTSYEGFLELEKNYSSIEWVPLANPIRHFRGMKEAGEIESLRKAAKLTLRGMEHVIQFAQEGIREDELALEFEVYVRRNGGERLSFDPIIAFGENSAYPHHRAGGSRLQKDQVILFDAGAVVDNYRGDLTRIFYYGKPDSEIKRLERIVREAQEAAIEKIKPGVLVGELDQLVRNFFDKENVNQLYTHSLGHGIGLETHEFPLIRSRGKESEVPLREGMVITVEPGLYQRGLGGVRLEEMILVTAFGGENLLDR